MKMKSWLKITVAVICLLSILCFAVACGKDKPKDTEAPTGETTPSETTGDNNTDNIVVGGDDVADNDSADDIGDEVVLPPLNF